MPTYPPTPFIAAQTGDIANPDCRCASAMQAMFCLTGHMTECHYPLTCDAAQCSHWEREMHTSGRYPDDKRV